MGRIALALTFAAAFVTSHASGEWFRVRVDVPTPTHLARLLDSDLLLYACEATLGTTDVVVGPGDYAKLNFAGFSHRTVQKLRDPNDVQRFERPAATDYRNEYFNLAEITAFFDGLAASARKNVRKQSLGTTIQGRTIWGYRFSGPEPSTGADPNAIVIVGLTHAREWVSGSSVMHIAKMLRDQYRTPASSGWLANKVVWIVPVMNPDGYSYTWTNNRLWRKNRRNNGDGTRGVDLNRNYGKGWGGQGSSGDTSSDVYRGTAPFSEAETSAVRSLGLSLPRLGAFIDFHSYSQLILWPWGYTTALAPGWQTLQSHAIAMKAAAEAYGQDYTQGQSSTTLYIAAGNSKDWFFDTKAAASYTIELRDTGQFGFELPTNQITPTQNEAFAAFRALVERTPR